jgi:WD40 repeat protein
MAPLQVYHSALIFSPAGSIIRNRFLEESPTWINSLPLVEKNWSPFLQTLEGHSDWVNTVAFSPDGRLLASGSGDGTVRLWGPATGAAVQTLEGHSDPI